MNEIIIKGAREHNLKNINLTLPKNKLIVFSGISGSGKSSLAFDTIYAEGQRRYVESLSSYARQFLGVMNKPDVDFLEGLSPAISIDQKSTSHNPRSTVGTVTEIYDYLRLLFARIGHPHCPKCNREISRQSLEQIISQMMEILIAQGNKFKRPVRALILAPVVREKKGEFSNLFENIKKQGYSQVRIDNQIYNLNDDLFLIKTNKHTIEIVIDKISFSPKQLKQPEVKNRLKNRLFDSVRRAVHETNGLVILARVFDPTFTFPEKPTDFEDHLFSEMLACPVDNISLGIIEPRSFSFNSPFGACPNCSGIGTLLKINPQTILNPNLSIMEGGILPYGQTFEKDTWYSRLILTVCQQYGIDSKDRIAKLTGSQQKIILFGTGEDIYEVNGTNRFGKQTVIYQTFEGIVNNLERRYKETESDYIRRDIEKYMFIETCSVCKGTRLKNEILAITINNFSIADVCQFSIKDALIWIQNLKNDQNILSVQELAIAKLIIEEITRRLQFLLSVGLDYITLDRSANSLAGGEAQRIRLASQIGSGLTGVLYVLDEPSIGLHQRDNQKLIDTLKKLRDLGNTVIVVEHDKKTLQAADLLVDFGPGAGDKGGRIVACGTPDEIQQNKNSLTGLYLGKKRKITRLSKNKRISENKELVIKGCSEQNLKNIDVSLPLNKLICITGVSGSGKSTLLETTLYHAVMAKLNPFHRIQPGRYKSLVGLENLKKVILIDQQPIGRTPRSNPCTYTGTFTYIRELFSQTQQARINGYDPGYFSFNVKGGRCEACEGEGQLRIEMQFMSDIFITCEVCQGKRYNSSTLEIYYKNKNIADILNLTVDEAYQFFLNIPPIERKLLTLSQVGLGYIKLGQPATMLSGGEAQRIKLATELAKNTSGQALYLLDEPTTGLHFADLEKLLNVLQLLVDKGNTVVVIEHNMDIIKNADWIIDLGPEGGDKGGEIIAQGLPQTLVNNHRSYTGFYLKKELSS